MRLTFIVRFTPPYLQRISKVYPLNILMYRIPIRTSGNKIGAMRFKAATEKLERFSLLVAQAADYTLRIKFDITPIENARMHHVMSADRQTENC